MATARPIAPELDPLQDFIFNVIPERAARPEPIPTSARTLTDYPVAPTRDDLRSRLTDAQRDRLASVKGRGVSVAHFHRERRLLEIWAPGDDGTAPRSIKLLCPDGSIANVYRRVRSSLPPRVWKVRLSDDPLNEMTYTEAWQHAQHVAIQYAKPLVEPDGNVIPPADVFAYQPAAHWLASPRLDVVEPAVLPGEENWPAPQPAIGDAWMAEVARRG